MKVQKPKYHNIFHRSLEWLLPIVPIKFKQTHKPFFCLIQSLVSVCMQHSQAAFRSTAKHIQQYSCWSALPNNGQNQVATNFMPRNHRRVELCMVFHVENITLEGIYAVSFRLCSFWAAFAIASYISNLVESISDQIGGSTGATLLL